MRRIPAHDAKMVGTVAFAFPVRILVLGIMMVGILLRLLHLDADPDYYEWIGYLTDEGRWVAHARELALLGHVTYNWPLHLHFAPLFQAAHYVVFMMFGVSLWSARILTACAGSALLVGFWWVSRRSATAEALALGMALLALETDLVVLSRITVPEMIVMVLEFCVFAVLVSPSSTARRAALAGVVLLVAVGVKVTASPMLAVFCLVCLLIPRDQQESRLVRLAAFVGGFAVPLLLMGLAALAWSPGAREVLSSSVTTVREFLRPATTYESASFLFESSLSPLFALWGLALWISLLGWMSAARNAAAVDDRERQMRRVLVGAVVWILSYAVLMLGLDYFPSRYKIHILIPIAIAITLGLSLLQRVGLAAAEENLQRRQGAAGWMFSAALALPAAVMLAPLLTGALGLAGMGSASIRARVAAIIVAGLLVTPVLHRWRGIRASATIAVLWPVLGAAAWTLARRTGMTSFNLWPTRDFAGHLMWWGSSVLVAAVIAAIVTIAVRRAAAQAIGRATIAAALGYVLLSALRLGPALAMPTYTIREASRDLGAVLAGMPDVSTTRAEGLFNENRIRFQSLRRSQTDRPDAWVTVLRIPNAAARVLRADYCVLKTYPLSVSKEYLRENRAENIEESTHVRVWIPRSSGGCPAGEQVVDAPPPRPQP